MTRELSVVVVDDHPVFRLGMSALLAALESITVVGEASDEADAVATVAEKKPDVVVMDLDLGGPGHGGTGIEATRQIVRDQPDVGVLVVTMMGDDDSVFAALRAGARGYLLKGAAQEEIVAAIRAVVAGQAIFGPGVAARVLGYFTAPPTPRPDPFPELTEREREILDLLASGRRTTAIAEALFLSPKTVSNHLTSIFAKLEVADRAAAIIRAREGGLGT